MPTFDAVYNNAPAPSVHSTRHTTKSSHPTSLDHIPADARPLDVRRMSSSKVGMGRTRGTERGSKPDEAPIGPEFATRTRDVGGSDEGSTSVGKRALAAYEKRSGSSGSPRNSSSDEPDTVADPPAVVNDKPGSPAERRGSVANFFKNMF
jgi:hypothetical protein